MTANQVAFRNSLEEGRHNRAYEIETNRHNVKTEELSAEANAIQNKATEYTREYQQAQTRLQQEYNDWYMRYSEATTAKKQELEAEGNRIKSEMNDINRYYNEQMVLLRSDENRLKSEAQKETSSHNANTEMIERYRAQNERLFNTQRLEFEKTSLNEQVNQWGIKNLMDVYSTYSNAWRSPLSGFMTDLNTRAILLNDPNSKIDVYTFLYGGNTNGTEKKQTPKESKRGTEEGSSSKKSGEGLNLTIRAEDFRRETK